jgi:AcrR family transcriptional regulator
MPPRQKFSHADVIEAAFQIVRRHGWEGLSARAIAKALNSSTRPVYDYFKSMKNIEIEVVKKALATFVEYIGRERTGDRWLDQALGYVLFASSEKHLFRCINDEAHIHYQKEFARKHWEALGEQLSNDERFKDLPEEAMHRIRAVRWFLVHGISFLACNGWNQVPAGETSAESEKLLGMSLKELLDQANSAIYEGFKDIG